MPNRIALFTSGGVSQVIGLHNGAYPLQCPLELPLCELITCPAPEQLANGFLRGNNYTFGNSIIYECNSGYTLRGDRSRICLKNGIWSGRAPSCSVVTCQLPEALISSHKGSSAVLHLLVDKHSILVGPCRANPSLHENVTISLKLKPDPAMFPFINGSKGGH
jgi:hypothetical protein